jgi:hypothetical protein
VWASSAAAAFAAALALVSALNTGPHVWSLLRDGHATYAAYSDERRRHAAVERLGLSPEVFEFYRDRVVRGDRFYLQVGESGLGQFLDQPASAGYAARFTLLPAVQARGLSDATVVLTLFEDPARLGVEFVTQEQAGLQPFYVSRIRAP